MLSKVASAGVLFLLCHASARSTALDIIRQSIEAERDNRRRMVNYLFQEDISRRAFDRWGNPISGSELTYEVLFIEGRPAFRKTSINGRPLSDDEQQAETARLRRIAEDRKRNPQKASVAEEKRRAHPFHRFPELHDFRMAGEEDYEGRACWVIDSRPRRKLRAQSRDDKRIAESAARFWIDKETLHRVRMDVISLRTSREKTTYRWAQRDGSVWLITGIETVMPAPGNGDHVAYYEAEQRYSRYRRFLSESSISAFAEAVP